MKKLLALSFILGTPAIAAAPPAASPEKIDRITAQLYYEYSGTLSENIAAPAEFALWNTIIGEGDAKEPADDVLVTVFLRGKAELVGFAPLKIVAKDAKGKVLGQRNAEPTLADKDGKAAAALMLYDVGCAGKVTITAMMGKSWKTSIIDFACGE